MQYLDCLVDNTLLVVPNDIKEDIILEVTKEKPLINIKYNSLENLRRAFFEYNEKANTYSCDLRETPIKRNGGHRQLRIVATDRRGNKAEFSSQVEY